MKVLIVEDSKLVSERLRLALAELPRVEITMADRLETALLYLRESPPDMLVLDIDLPDGSGIALLTKVKRDAPKIRVAMFSNHPGFRQRCIAIGADFFFDKSADFENLIQTVGFLSTRLL